MSLLAVKNLRVTFDTEAGPVEAVRGVSFSLGRERLGIVGESGSGKTMTGRVRPAPDPPAGPDRGRRDGLRRHGPDAPPRNARCAPCAASASPW